MFFQMRIRRAMSFLALWFLASCASAPCCISPPRELCVCWCCSNWFTINFTWFFLACLGGLAGGGRLFPGLPFGTGLSCRYSFPCHFLSSLISDSLSLGFFFTQSEPLPTWGWGYPIPFHCCREEKTVHHKQRFDRHHDYCQLQMKNGATVLSPAMKKQCAHR